MTTPFVLLSRFTIHALNRRRRRAARSSASDATYVADDFDELLFASSGAFLRDTFAADFFAIFATGLVDDLILAFLTAFLAAAFFFISISP